MKFYCPKCQAEYETEPSGTVTTKTGRIAYKANCPSCGQDMAEFASFEPQTAPPSSAEPAPSTTPVPQTTNVSTTPSAQSPAELSQKPMAPLESPIIDPASVADAQKALDVAAMDISKKQ